MYEKWETVIDSVVLSLDCLEAESKIEAIDDLIHRLQFERRWFSLAPNQVQHMCDESLSRAEHEALEKCTSEKQRDDLFSNYARTRYFRQCHWMMYLNGESEHVPIEAAKAAGGES